MRILHVNKFLYRRGGAEGYMLDLAELQRGRGHDVSFFAMEHPDNQADVNADLFPPRMELNPPPSGFGARVATSVDILYRRSARIGMDAVLDRVRPDVVHLHNIYHQLSPSILRPVKRRGIPTVMTLHDYKLACPTYQFLDNGKICEACIPRKFRNAALKACNGSRGASALAAGRADRPHRPRRLQAGRRVRLPQRLHAARRCGRPRSSRSGSPTSRTSATCRRSQPATAPGAGSPLRRPALLREGRRRPHRRGRPAARRHRRHHRRRRPGRWRRSAPGPRRPESPTGCGSPVGCRPASCTS